MVDFNPPRVSPLLYLSARCLRRLDRSSSWERKQSSPVDIKSFRGSCYWWGTEIRSILIRARIIKHIRLCRRFQDIQYLQTYVHHEAGVSIRHSGQKVQSSLSRNYVETDQQRMLPGIHWWKYVHNYSSWRSEEG